MSVALHGNLRDFGIGEVFQLIGQQQKTGVLDVTGADARVRIAFDRGGVVWGEPVGPYEHAALGDRLVRSGLVTPEHMLECERGVQDGDGDLRALIVRGGGLGEAQLQEAVDLLTHDTMFTLLRWTQGSFHFTAQPVVGEGDSAKSTPAEQILMDGLRMVDEWRTFDADAREIETVWRRSEAFDVFRERAEGDSPARIAQAERVFSLVDGRTPGRRLVDLARLGEFDGVYWLSRLRRAGVIDPLPRESARPIRRARLAFSGAPLDALRVLAPFALVALAVLALFLQRGGEREVAPGAAALARAADASFERALLRNAVEAYRFRHGDWPADLAEAVRELPEPMATEKLDAYYFARRGDNFVVLLPEE
ncbi:MAG TPA: DUF4388 domain-containing protein [Myxococcota bacterium]|jgi:hypothetical protein